MVAEEAVPALVKTEEAVGLAVDATRASASSFVVIVSTVPAIKCKMLEDSKACDAWFACAIMSVMHALASQVF